MWCHGFSLLNIAETYSGFELVLETNIHVNRYLDSQISSKLEREKGGFFRSRLSHLGVALKLKLQFKLEDASRYG